MKAFLILGCLALLLYTCAGCGSTLRLDYDGGKSGKVGAGITFPDTPQKFDRNGNPNFGLKPSR